MGKPKSKRVRKEMAPMRAGAFDLSRKWIIGLVLSVTFFAFANTMAFSFAYDDQTQILKNDFIKDLRNAPMALVTEAWFWRAQQDKDPREQDKPSTPYYRPIVMLYLMIGWKLFGTWAAGWHLLSLLTHLVVVYCSFLLIEKVTGDGRLAAIASLLFAIHPMRSESVAWISGITDLLLAVFLIPSFLFYVRYRERGELRYVIWSAGLFLLAAFTKEPAVALPLFIGAYELLVANQEKPLRERLTPALVNASLFLLLSAAYFGMRMYALGFLINNLGFTSYSTTQILSTIPLVIWKYIGLLLFPVNLTLFHETILVDSPLDVRFVLPTLGLVALAAALWPLRKSIPARFAILWLAVNLMPVMNLGAFTQEFLVQERYVYVPSIGFSLLIAMALINIPVERWFTLGSRRTARALLIALVVLALTGKTLAQNTVWKDDMTLWKYGVEAAPDQPLSHYVLGHKYLDLGDLEKAKESFEAYVKLNPNNMIVVSNLAAAHLLTYQNQAAFNPAAADRTHLDRAAALCEKGLSFNENQPTLWDTLGTVYTFDTSLRNYDRAVWCFNRALSLQPDNALVNFHLGATLAKQGNNDAAFRYLETARSLHPQMADVYKFLAYLYRAKGEVQLAIDNLSQYLRLSPNAVDAQRISKDVHDLQAQLKSASPQADGGSP